MSANRNGENREQREKDAQLIQAARRALDSRDAGLDAETLSRLRRIRARAAETQEAHKPGGFSLPWVWPAGSAVAAGVLAVLLWPQPPQVEPAHKLLLGDTWLLEKDADLEMIAQADFYLWLAEIDES